VSAKKSAAETRMTLDRSMPIWVCVWVRVVPEREKVATFIRAWVLFASTSPAAVEAVSIDWEAVSSALAIVLVLLLSARTMPLA
jgi:hypothetical protein